MNINSLRLTCALIISTRRELSISVLVGSFIEAVLPFVPKHPRGETDEISRLKVTLFAAASGLSSRTLDRMGWVSHTTVSSWVNEITEAIVKAPIFQTFSDILAQLETSPVHYSGKKANLVKEVSMLVVQCAIILIIAL